MKCKQVLKLEKINLKIKSRKCKMVYNCKAHLKNINNYLKIPYKNHLVIEMCGVDKKTCEKDDVIKDKTLNIIKSLKLSSNCTVMVSKINKTAMVN